MRESRALVVNLLSLVRPRQQWQFRGWWRTENEYFSLARRVGKSVKTIKMNPKKLSATKTIQLALQWFISGHQIDDSQKPSKKCSDVIFL